MERNYRQAKLDFNKYLEDNNFSIENILDTLKLTGKYRKRNFYDFYFPTPSKIDNSAEHEARVIMARKLYGTYGIPPRFLFVSEEEIETPWNVHSVMLNRINLYNFEQFILSPFAEDEIQPTTIGQYAIKDSDREIKIKDITEYTNDYPEEYIQISAKYIDKLKSELWFSILLDNKIISNSEEDKNKIILEHYCRVQSYLFKIIETKLTELSDSGKKFEYVLNLILPTFEISQTHLGHIFEACLPPLVAHIIKCCKEFDPVILVSKIGINKNLIVVDQKYTINEYFRFSGSTNGYNYLLPDVLIVEKFSEKKYLPTTIEFFNILNSMAKYRNAWDFREYLCSQKQKSMAIEYLQHKDRKTSFQRVEKILLLLNEYDYEFSPSSNRFVKFAREGLVQGHFIQEYK